MPTIDLTARATIDAPAQEVWAVLADCTNDTRWRGGVVEMSQSTSGPVVLGTTTHETMRTLGSTLRTVTAVTQVKPGRSFRWVAVEGLDLEGARHLAESAGGQQSVVCLELRYTTRGFGQRLFFPLMSRMLARTLDGDARRFRALCTAGTRIP